MANINLNDPTIKKVKVSEYTGKFADLEDYIARFEQWERENLRAGETVLTLHVTDCADLMPADLNGLSDPYLVVICGDQRIKTNPIKKTLNPRFNFKHEFKIDPSKFTEITIEVWDYDKFSSDDFLGCVHLNVAKLLDGKTSFEKRLRLLPRRYGDPIQGDVGIKLSCNHVLPLIVPDRFSGRKQGIFDFELPTVSSQEEVSLLTDAELNHFNALRSLTEQQAQAFDALRAVCVIPADNKTDVASVPPRSRKTSKKNKDTVTGGKKEFTWDVIIGEEQSGGQLGLNHLPEEVLVHIFRFLTDFERGKLATVCKSWYRVLSDVSLKSLMAQAIERYALAQANPTYKDAVLDAAKAILKLYLFVYNLASAYSELRSNFVSGAFIMPNDPYRGVAILRQIFSAVNACKRICNWANAIKATKIDFRSMFRFAADHVNELDSSFADKYRQLNTPTVNYADTLFDPHVSLFTLDHTLPVSACVPIINNLYTVIKAKRYPSEDEFAAALKFFCDGVIATSELSDKLYEHVKLISKYAHLIPLSDLQLLSTCSGVHRVGASKLLLTAITGLKQQ